VKERQESELVNNADYGFLHRVVPQQRVKARTGAPTPDDLDEMQLVHSEQDVGRRCQPLFYLLNYQILIGHQEKGASWLPQP
jgi:hypothetical protein